MLGMGACGMGERFPSCGGLVEKLYSTPWVGYLGNCLLTLLCMVTEWFCNLVFMFQKTSRAHQSLEKSDGSILDKDVPNTANRNSDQFRGSKLDKAALLFFMKKSLGRMVKMPHLTGKYGVALEACVISTRVYIAAFNSSSSAVRHGERERRKKGSKEGKATKPWQSVVAFYYFSLLLRSPLIFAAAVVKRVVLFRRLSLSERGIWGIWLDFSKLKGSRAIGGRGENNVVYECVVTLSRTKGNVEDFSFFIVHYDY